MLTQAVKSTVRGNHIALGAVLALGLAGQAVAGTSLSCAGYPRNEFVFTGTSGGHLVQVCKIVSLTAPLTPSLSVLGNIGNVTAHGGQTEKAIPVFARIIAQDGSIAAATALANSVVITTTNATVTSKSINVTFPRSVGIDYEVFTPSTTEASLSVAAAGNVSADHYTVQLNASTKAGDISLHTIDGDVHAKSSAGNLLINLSGTAWTGSGLTASTSAGNILLLRPEGYQARITATADVGEAEVDGKTKFFPFPATLTAGSGQPIKLTSSAGNVAVIHTANQ